MALMRGVPTKRGGALSSRWKAPLLNVPKRPRHSAAAPAETHSSTVLANASVFGAKYDAP